MKYKKILLVLISVLYSFNSFEIDFGYQNPQGHYDKYNDPGYSIRATFSKPDELFPYIKYDFSMQYLKFKNDYWVDYTSSYLPIEYNHSEQSFGILAGPRLMSPTKKGAFRPYVGAKVGIFFFTETINADWGYDWYEDEPSLLGCLFWEFLDTLDGEDDSDCDPDLSSYTQTLDLEAHFGMLLEIGTNFNPSNQWGVDFGIQYNIIPSIKPEYEYEEQEEEGGIINVHINKISNIVNADYVTFYIGFNFNFEGDH